MSAPRQGDAVWTPAAIKDFRQRFPRSAGPSRIFAEEDRLERIRDSVRELELRKEQLIAHIAEMEARIEIERLAERAEALTKKGECRATLRQIVKLVSEATGVPVSEIRGERRMRNYAEARQIAMWLAKKHCPHLSLIAIGNWFNRDHSTIIHAGRVVEARMRRLGPIIDYVEARLPIPAFSSTPLEHENRGDRGVLRLPSELSKCHQQRVTETEARLD